MSPQQERAAGRDAAADVERTVGLVRDPGITGYVGEVGARLIRAAGRPEIAWQINVADDPDTNAFALPGGWVYVTRGLLALTNREDELAGVLGHEMAHVIERHAATRVGAAAPFAVLFGVPSGILGKVSPTLGGVVSGVGGLITGAALAPYSREQEREADRAGVALAARAGWDPAALAAFLATLERAEAMADGGGRRPGFFDTHPSTPERIDRVRALARDTTRGPEAAIAPTRAAFLARLDGLVVGDNAANGIFAGATFLHPEFDLALDMPARWKTASAPSMAGAVAPDEDALVVLQLVGPGDDPAAGARADGVSESQLGSLRRVTIAGLPAARVTAATRDGDRVGLTWIAHRKRVFRVAGVTAAADWERYRPAFDRTALSVRPLRPADRPSIVQSRLRVRPARAGQTVGEVLARGGSTWTPAQAAVVNAVDAGFRLEAGWPVKVAVSERYGT